MVSSLCLPLYTLASKSSGLVCALQSRDFLSHLTVAFVPCEVATLPVISQLCLVLPVVTDIGSLWFEGVALATSSPHNLGTLLQPPFFFALLSLVTSLWSCDLLPNCKLCG